MGWEKQTVNIIISQLAPNLLVNPVFIYIYIYMRQLLQLVQAFVIAVRIAESVTVVCIYLYHP